VPIGVLSDLREKDCDLYLHKQGIDTSTSSGKMLFQMLSVFAEFEREMIRERVVFGLERARAKGVKLGRRPISQDRVRKIKKLREQGWGMNRISRELRVGSATVQRICR
jgi:DNA invertase Pin-like site-specific DNA recombinase